jgi:hypothetical protein
MASKILVLGESGSGKTTATRNMDPKSTYFINCIGKPLPFRGWKKNYKEGKGGNLFKSTNWEEIVKCMHAISEQRQDIKTIVVDDAQYIMSFEFMQRAKEVGFNKFTEIAQHMFEVFITPERLRNDITVIYLCHSDDVSANGFTKTKIKTIGKMLDDKITLEGLFTIVLLAGSYKSEEGMKYVFLTNSDGTTTAKSPEGMFEKLSIDNDLAVVLETIRRYEEE